MCFVISVLRLKAFAFGETLFLRRQKKVSKARKCRKHFLTARLARRVNYMDVMHKRRPQVAATTLALNSFSWPRRGTNEVSIKPGPKSCVQGGWATRSSLPTPHSNTPSLKTLTTQFFWVHSGFR